MVWKFRRKFLVVVNVGTYHSIYVCVLFSNRIPKRMRHYRYTCFHMCMYVLPRLCNFVGFNHRCGKPRRCLCVTLSVEYLPKHTNICTNIFGHCVCLTAYTQRHLRPSPLVSNTYKYEEILDMRKSAGKEKKTDMGNLKDSGYNR